MQCPECGGENCQRYEVINAYGTSVTHSAGVGVGVGIGGSVGVGLGTYRGVNSTKIGTLTAPPKQLTYGRSIFFLIIWCSFGIGMLSDNLYSGGFMFLIFAFFPSYKIFRCMRYNTNKWPALYEEWKHTWFCNQCGNSFSDM